MSRYTGVPNKVHSESVFKMVLQRPLMVELSASTENKVFSNFIPMSDVYVQMSDCTLHTIPLPVCGM